MKTRSLLLISFLLLLSTFSAIAEDRESDLEKVRHVLLISIDGLHALDVATYIANHPHSAMAQLAHHGVTYTNARTPANSDSFPGLLALVTGGSPVTHGIFYDVSYDRTSLIRPTQLARERPAIP